jgi:hypothetical protein
MAALRPLLFLLILAMPGPALCETWTLRALTLEWPAGFRQVNADPLQFANGEGVAVTVDVMGPDTDDEVVQSQMAEGWRAYVRNDLLQLARSHGEVVVMRDETTAAGLPLSVIAIRQQRDGQARFGIFFVMISIHGQIAQIMVEGPGDPLARLAEYRPIFETARWRD